MPKFKIYGKVIKDSEAGTQVLAQGGTVKEAESAEALKAEWEAAMWQVFPMGPDYNVEYFCQVTPEIEE